MARTGRHVSTAGRTGRHRGKLIVGSLLLIVSVVCATVLLLLMHANDTRLASEGASHVTLASRMTAAQRDGEIRQAEEYNRRLAASGQDVIGDAKDSFSDDTPKYDDEYLKELDEPSDGIMATVSYPRLGIDLPIRHGTTTSVLDRGAGHVYGTSLPVGGENTHAVISAHTGLADQIMFDRLHSLGGKAEKGDVFYVRVVNKTLAYKVTSIRVITPDQFDPLRIEPGKDLVTLLTCTPYGVNSKRLLVTGERAAMPGQAPLLKDAPADHMWWWAGAGVGLFWLLVVAVIVFSVRRGRSYKSRRRRGRPRRRRRPSHEPKPDTQEIPIVQS